MKRTCSIRFIYLFKYSCDIYNINIINFTLVTNYEIFKSSDLLYSVNFINLYLDYHHINAIIRVLLCFCIFKQRIYALPITLIIELNKENRNHWKSSLFILGFVRCICNLSKYLKLVTWKYYLNFQWIVIICNALWNKTVYFIY